MRPRPEEQKPVARAAKRALDVALAGAGMVALAPVLAALAAAIRLDSPGPAIFVQDRVGLGGRIFRLRKLRTMTTGAPVRFHEDGSTRIDAGDARVTRVGRYLRGAPDELPQLWNVLVGDMSLVGPRPDMPVHAELYTDDEREKLRVRPGLTSLAAVLGRNELPWKQRIAIDLCYIDRWSLGLDAKIALQTLLLPLGVRLFDFRDVVPPHVHPEGPRPASNPPAAAASPGAPANGAVPA